MKLLGGCVCDLGLGRQLLHPLQHQRVDIEHSSPLR